MEDYLAHYGILGMKWGVRRTEAQLARVRGKKKSSSESDDEKENAKSAKPKKASEMSDAELRERLNRINMEDQYNAAMARRNPDRFQRAKKVVADLAENAVRSAGTKVIEKAMKSIFGEKEKKTNYRNINLETASDKAVQDALKRATQEASLKKILSGSS